MKRKLCIVLLLCVVSVMMSGCASHQIARQGKKVESQEEKIESLIIQLGDQDIVARRNVANELACIGKPAIPALIEALSHQESRIRGNAALVLGWIGQPARDTVPNLTQALSDVDEKVRRNAAFALSEIKIESLIMQLGDESPFSKEAVDSLVQIGMPAVPVLISTLQHKDNFVRAGAVRALEKIGAPEAMKAVEKYESKERRGRITREILAGTVVGSVGGIAAWRLVPRVFPELTYDDEIALPLVMVVSTATATAFAVILGASTGVYVVGNTGNETGSFAETGTGSVLGFSGGIVGSVVVAILGDGLPDTSFIVGTTIGATIGATLGFNNTRRYKLPPVSGNALINFSDGQMSLAVPRISFDSDRYARGTFTRRVDLVKMGF